jgi:hypothetical protein
VQAYCVDVPGRLLDAEAKQLGSTSAALRDRGIDRRANSVSI